VSKNDRVPGSREYVAHQIANIGNNTAEDIEPDADDYAYADYLLRNARDPHGYIRLAWRIGAALAGVTLIILTLSHPWSAQ